MRAGTRLVMAESLASGSCSHEDGLLAAGSRLARGADHPLPALPAARGPSRGGGRDPAPALPRAGILGAPAAGIRRSGRAGAPDRSEEHTSELQSHLNLVCRLLLEKKKKQ